MKLLSGGVLFRRTKKVHWPTGLAPKMKCSEALWIGTGFGIAGGMLQLDHLPASSPWVGGKKRLGPLKAADR
ncbi:hypothetical protein, partial [Mesorhizobium sp.]|uniref:hypothetical protein n=1 Tax=Mesorhizobium sp. TaxID=1871066 RepID=UPI0025798A08